MPNNTGWANGNPGNNLIYIPAGYHNGSGYVDARQSYNDGKQIGYNNGYNTAINLIPQVAPIEVYDPHAYYYVGTNAVHISDSIIIQLTNKEFYNTIVAERSDGGTVSLKVVKFVWNGDGNYYETHQVKHLGYNRASLSSVNKNEYIQASFTDNTVKPGLRVRLTK